MTHTISCGEVQQMWGAPVGPHIVETVTKFAAALPETARCAALRHPGMCRGRSGLHCNIGNAAYPHLTAAMQGAAQNGTGPIPWLIGPGSHVFRWRRLARRRGLLLLGVHRVKARLERLVLFTGLHCHGAHSVELFA